VLGIDQNVDYPKYTNQAYVSELMDFFLNAGFLPTITKPTRIMHSKATHFDNKYIKTSKEIKLASGIILNNILDHLPVFLFSEKYKSMKTEPLIFEHRNSITTGINKFVRPYQKQIDLV